MVRDLLIMAVQCWPLMIGTWIALIIFGMVGLRHHGNINRKS